MGPLPLPVSLCFLEARKWRTFLTWAPPALSALSQLSNSSASQAHWSSPTMAKTKFSFFQVFAWGISPLLQAWRSHQHNRWLGPLHICGKVVFLYSFRRPCVSVFPLSSRLSAWASGEQRGRKFDLATFSILHCYNIQLLYFLNSKELREYNICMYMHLCICIYIYVKGCECVCVCVHLHIYQCMCVCMCIIVCIICVYVCVFMYLCIYVNMYVIHLILNTKERKHGYNTCFFIICCLIIVLYMLYILKYKCLYLIYINLYKYIFKYLKY